MMESDKNQQNLEYEKKVKWRKAQIRCVKFTDILLVLVYVFFAIYVILKNAMNMRGVILLVVITLFNVWMIPILLKKMKQNIFVYTMFIFFDISIIISFFIEKESLEDKGWVYLIFFHSCYSNSNYIYF